MHSLHCCIAGLHPVVLVQYSLTCTCKTYCPSTGSVSHLKRPVNEIIRENVALPADFKLKPFKPAADKVMCSAQVVTVTQKTWTFNSA